MDAPFHLAFPVNNLEATRAFYVDVLDCRTGRESESWIDFDLYGHQIVAHMAPDETDTQTFSSVDEKAVPVKHFGVVLPWAEWCALADRLRASGVEFHIEPYVRFEGEVGEQATMFFPDPSGNFLEFKSFKDPSQLFAKDLKQRH
jgi:uncharacterized protein